jgi:SNF2 family DNA or RNA helicase
LPIVIHANFSSGLLHLWSEDATLLVPAHAASATDGAPAPNKEIHPFATRDVVLPPALLARATPSTLALRLPSTPQGPLPSATLARALGRSVYHDDTPHALAAVGVPTLAMPMDVADEALAFVLSECEEAAEDAEPGLFAGASLAYFEAASRLARHLLIQQRFIPSLVQAASGELKGAWQGWLNDAATSERVVALVRAMPPSARASVDSLQHDAWSVTEQFLHACVDAECRRSLVRENYGEALEDKSPDKDAHVAWLSGLLDMKDRVLGPLSLRQDLARRFRTWVGSLEERGASAAWRLLFRISEPPGVRDSTDGPAPDAPAWALSFHLQAVEQTGIILDAEDVWLITGEAATIMGRRVERPRELLLGELGRASRLYRALEGALTDDEPTKLMLSTRAAYDFLREQRPILMEQGFAVEAPAWWDSPASRLGAKLRLDASGEDPLSAAAGGLTNAAKAQIGLSALVNYTWEIAVGDTTLTLHEFEQLAAKRTPLVKLNGRWVEIRPEDVQAAVKFIRENPGGSLRLGDAIRLAYGSDLKQTGIPVVGLEASGWLSAFMNAEAASKQLQMIEPPAGFRGTLRPYQARGVSWMAFQEQLGFGVCLADDMGLGKTVQLLALLAWEREIAAQVAAHTVDRSAGASAGLEVVVPAIEEPAPTVAAVDAAASSTVAIPGLPAPLHTVAPTLLLVPMSVVGNWMHETKRFCPSLRLLVHHGPDRALGDAFVEKANSSDLIVTTYALANRDKDLLARVSWGRIVLDEAQYIKNPAAKQSQAVRGFVAPRRVALTGTPVENRLTELWSIMDFLNPGYLGSAGSFRSRFAVPVERYHDKQKAEQLRSMVRPFILRRLKSDPTVVADLPEKVETKEHAHLTAEQASLYESCVKRMLNEVEDADGMQRRGLVLAALVRLKQICNHPSMLLKDWNDDGLRPPDPGRSGKCIRLLEMLDEIIAEGDQSLVFTQFREAGTLLEAMIAHRFGKDVLFIHGGTTQPQRQAIIERFQKADGTTPVLILSLRAGGVGLNLTAATHVFHFDRWWNPAVENQATDRAYRIGQTRTVQVHKFLVRGTLEERIDEMIESKTELAQNIIGSGETWISEMNTDQLREILTLRNDAVDDEA